MYILQLSGSVWLFVVLSLGSAGIISGTSERDLGAGPRGGTSERDPGEQCYGIPAAYWHLWQATLEDYYYGSEQQLRQYVHAETTETIDPLNETQVVQFGCEIANVKSLSELASLIGYEGESESERMSHVVPILSAYRRIGKVGGMRRAAEIREFIHDLLKPYIDQFQEETIDEHPEFYNYHEENNPPPIFIEPIDVYYIVKRIPDAPRQILQTVVDKYGANFLDYIVMEGTEIVITDVDLLVKNVLSGEITSWDIGGIEGLDETNIDRLGNELHDVLTRQDRNRRREAIMIEMYAAYESAGILDLKI